MFAVSKSGKWLAATQSTAQALFHRPGKNGIVKENK